MTKILNKPIVNKFVDRQKATVTLFKGATDTKPKQLGTLEELFDIITNENENWVLLCNQLKEAKNNNPVEYKRLKQQITWAFLPGAFTERNKTGLQEYVSLLCMDFDNCQDPAGTIEKLKAIPYIYAAFPSPSYQGVRALVWANSTPETHKAVYLAICDDLSQLTGTPLNEKEREHIDTSRNAFSSFWFFTHVPKGPLFYHNEESTTFYYFPPQQIEDQENQIKKDPPKPSPAHQVNGSLSIDDRIEAAWRKLEDSNTNANGRNDLAYQLVCHMIEFGVTSPGRIEAEMREVDNKYPGNHQFTDDEITASRKSAEKRTQQVYTDKQILNFLDIGRNGRKAPENSVQQTEPAPEPDKLKKHVFTIAKMRRGEIGKNGGYETPEEAIKATRVFLKKMDKLHGPKIDKLIEEAFRLKWDELIEITGEDHLYEIKHELSKLYEFRFNLITRKPDYKEKGGEWEPITDFILNTAVIKLKSKGIKKASKDMIATLIESSFAPQVNPIIEYFRRLEWDRGKHIDTLCATIDPAGDNEAEARAMFKKYLTKWLVASIANVHNKKRCENHQVFILSGPQGCGKSTWMKALCPKALEAYYIESMLDPKNKDKLLATAENFIFNLDDHLAATTGKKDMNELKSFITQNTIKERASYGRFTEGRPKIANFLASTNEAQFLHDTTGNRRWMPFRILGVHWDKLSKVDIDQVWAEAYQLYKDGYAYHLNKDDIAEVNYHNKQFETQSAEYEMITTYFRAPNVGEEPHAHLTPSEIIKRIQEHHDKIRLSTKKLGEALNQLGFERVQRTRNGKRVWGYEVIVERGRSEEPN